MLNNLTYITPEIFISIFALSMLMFGVFSSSTKLSRIIFILSSAAIVFAVYLLFNQELAQVGGKALLFNNSFVVDRFSSIMKILILASVFSVNIIALNNGHFAKNSNKLFEFPVLILLATVGMLILTSANDLTVMYMGLELMSLALYVLVAVNRDSEISTESAVKYFILGALASGIILLGISFIYGFMGSTNLITISEKLYNFHSFNEIPKAAVIGMVLILCGMFFKISAAPMHMWAPDVYEGATKVVLSLIATAPKVAALAFLMRFTAIIPAIHFPPFSQVMALVAIFSMVIGAFAALKQENIKRLISYSSIANMGFILVALSVGTGAAYKASLIYLIIYIITSIGIFAIISVMNKNDIELEKLSDFSGLAKTNPIYALQLAVLMFSIAGIPPMAGFLGKFFVFEQAIKQGFYALSVIGVLASVVSCYYYLRIIKIMYFDAPAIEQNKIIEKQPWSIRLLISASVLFCLTLIFYTGFLKAVADFATKSLF